MKMFKILIVSLFATLCFAGCQEYEFYLPKDPNGIEKPDDGDDEGEEPTDPDYPDTSWAEGELDWVFDMSALPEIRISVTEEQWNALLEAYDRNSATAEYIHCDAEFKSKGETHTFEDAGLRLRGNTSRRRPEGNGGEMHKTDNADWHHCHFMLNLRKYQKDHVAFFDDPAAVKLVELDNVCRQQQVNDGCFAALEDVPTHAYTLTIPTLVRAPWLFCTVPAATKAEAVKNTVLGPVSERCPASILRTRPNAVLFCDPDSGRYLV